MLCTESKNGWTVFASHPEDCSKFFICHAHRAFPIDCPEGTLYDKNLKICNHAYAVDCIKEPLKTSEKTDPSPCLKKGIGINPRDATLDSDSNCEEILTIHKSENQPTPPLPPCKLDIRLGDPESDYSDIIFDTEKCDPTLATDSAKIHTNKWRYELINSGNFSFPAHAY